MAAPALEAALSDLAEVAAYVCDTPFASIDLVEGDRVHQAARVGLAARPIGATSFGMQVIAGPGFLLVPDALADPRFDHDPYVTGETCVRSYAGVPVRTRDGTRIGAIGVMDRVVRTVSPRQVATLEILAGQIAMQLDLRGTVDVLLAARKEIEGMERRLRTLVEELPAAVYVDDASGDPGDLVPEYYSPRVEDLLGYPASAWLEDDELWVKCVHPDDLEWVDSLAESARLAGRPFDCEYRMVRRDGEVIWVSERAVLIKDEEGHPLYWQGIWFDITARKHAEAELEAALERERHANHDLRALDELKDLLLRTVSHDMRSPLTTVVGSAQTLQNAGLRLDEQEERDLVEGILRSGHKMQRLVSDLLDLDRLERGQVQPNRRPLDAGACVSRIVADLDVDRTVVVDAPAVEACVDPVQLERIVENLVLNACKHTPTEARIWVRVRVQDHELVVTVEDDGPGVPDAIRSEIFETFRKGDASSGVGIGLSVVARFAALHGGRAEVTDRDGGGARFEVHLPDDGCGSASESGGPNARPAPAA